jgi:hypothetical protein
VNSDKPQWYYVGNGTFRFWDGLIWTDEYRDGDDPGDALAEEYSGPKRRSQERRRVRLWVIGFTVVLTVALASVAVVLL